MQRRDPPATAEGWYALHDLRRVDWDAWRAAPERERERALAEAVEYLEAHEALEDADAGGSAVFWIVGHEADLLLLHLRPTMAHLDRAERAFEQTAFAEFTERTASYVSVTEVSGYVTEELGEGIENVESTGTRNYLRQRLHPTIPDAGHVSFYPMDKRREPGANWYDLPFDERAELMAGHGEVGREYAGEVTQIITGSVGFDDYEWGVTLFADDPTAIKHLLYEMRFDPSSSRFAEFGPFYFGRRVSPAQLPALLAGVHVPASGDDAGPADHERSDHAEVADDTETIDDAETDDAEVADDVVPGLDDGGSSPDERSASSVDARTEPSGRPPRAAGEPPHEDATTEELEQELRRLGFEADDYAAAGFGLVVYADADAEALVDDVDGLRGNFEHYDTHVLTSVRADAGRSAVVSLWDTERAANTASGFLFDLPGVAEGLGAPLRDSVKDGANDDETDADAPDATDGDAAETAGALDASDTSSDGSDADATDGVSGTDDHDDVRAELNELGVYAGRPHGEDVYALVLYSEADLDELREEVSTLADGFDRYDTHVGTSLYEGTATERAAVVSLWETREAARTAGDYLADLPGIVGRAGRRPANGASGGTAGPAAEASEAAERASGGTASREGRGPAERATGQGSREDGGTASPDAETSTFGTMGMFYTVKPEHREAFVDRFETVGDLLADTDGHLETDLLVNVDDENDMFVSSRWASKDDAMAFFRSEAFRETVQWGREVLADRPRHVFLA